MIRDIRDITNLAICLALPRSTIACYHLVKYEDVINGSTAVPPFKGWRISLINFNINKICGIMRDLFQGINKEECKKYQVTISGEAVLNNYLKEIQGILRINEVSVNNYDTCSTLGANFLLQNTENQVYKYKDCEIIEFPQITRADKLFPYLLVIVNAKMLKIIKVINCKESEEVANSAFDFNFVLIIAKRLFGSKINSVEEFLQFANENYKGRFLIEYHCDDGQTLAIYLLQTLLKNLSTIINIQAKLHKISKIIFCEYFQNEVFLDLLTKCFEDNEKESVDLEILFMRHNSFVAALGAFVKGFDVTDQSWLENYSVSSGILFTKKIQDEDKSHHLVLDVARCKLTVFPHLKDPKTYNPFLQNLFENKTARDYWLHRAEEGVKYGVQYRVQKDPKFEHNTVLLSYSKLFVKKVEQLRQHRYTFGPISFGIIQDTLYQIKKEVGILDTHYRVKKNETKVALSYFVERIKYFDKLSHNERHLAIAKSLLAGNLFDWGSKEVQKILSREVFDFEKAAEIVPKRPWLIDNLDLWIERLKGSPHKFALILPDNCGFDFLLGILPLARELIKGGTKVAMYVNFEPIINDLTTYEFEKIIKQVSLHCPIIRGACKSGQLLFYGNSRSSTYVDFRYINEELVENSEKIDLLVIDGMGRAVHSNLNAEFNIECVRVAVVKDYWLSEVIGGKDMAAIFRYTK